MYECEVFPFTISSYSRLIIRSTPVPSEPSMTSFTLVSLRHTATAFPSGQTEKELPSICPLTYFHHRVPREPRVVCAELRVCVLCCAVLSYAV